jgi:hypothetical protein
MAEKSSPGSRQTDGKNLVLFGGIERKFTKLSIPESALLTHQATVRRRGASVLT